MDNGIRRRMLCCLLDSGSFPVAIPVVLSTWYPKPGSNHMPYLREKERKREREKKRERCVRTRHQHAYTRDSIHPPHTTHSTSTVVQHIHRAYHLRSSFSSTYTMFRGVYMVNVYMHNAMYTGVHVAMKVAYN